MINKIGASSASINQGDSVPAIRQQLKQLYSPEHFETADQKKVKTLVTKLLKLTQGIPSRDIVDELLAHDFKEIKRFPEDAFIHSPIVEATLDALDEKDRIDQDDPLKVLLEKSLENWFASHLNQLFHDLCEHQKKTIIEHADEIYKFENITGSLALTVSNKASHTQTMPFVTSLEVKDLRHNNPFKMPDTRILRALSRVLADALLK